MNKKFIRVLFSMSFLLILGKGLGFVRSAFVASTYGAGFITDIYAFEDSFINEIYAVFSTFLACSFIPKYLSLDEKGKNRLFNLILNAGVVIMLVFTILCMIFTQPILKILVPGYFEIYDISYIVFITRVNLVLLILIFLVNYIMIILQAHEIFIYLTLESLLLNVIVILYLIIIPRYEILGLILCRIIAYILLFIFSLIKLKKVMPLKYKAYFNPKDNDLKDMIKLSLPMLCITILWQLNYVIDKSMASGLESGSVACLNYANTISMIIYNVIGYIVSTYAYPILGKLQNDKEKISSAFKEYLLVLMQLVLPISILTMFFSGYASNLLYGHGNMEQSSVQIISKILILYLPGSIAYCIKNLYAKLFYVKQNTKIVLVLDASGCLVNIGLNLLLVRIIGVYGLALGTSISSIVTVVLQIIFANKKEYTAVNLLDFRKMCFSTVVLIIVGALTSFILYSYIHNNIVQFVFVALVYICVCVVFCLNDLKHIVSK